MNKEKFFKGAIILTSAGIISRVLGFFYRIFLSHIIGSHGLGIYQLSMPIQALSAALAAGGIQTAISRLCSAQFAKNKKTTAYLTLFYSTGISFMISCLLTIFIRCNSSYIAVTLLKEPLTENLIRILAFSFPLSTLHTCVNSFYFAQHKTTLPATIQIIEQLVRTGSTYVIYLILLSQGKSITAQITAVSTLLCEVIAALISVIAILYAKQNIRISILPIQMKLLKQICSISFPLTLNKLSFTILNSIELILIPQMLLILGLDSTSALSMYGIFTGMALPLILFPSTLVQSVSVLLLPSVANLQARKKNTDLRVLIQKSLLFCFLLGAFCTCFFYICSNFLGNFLFQNAYSGLYIKSLSFICPFLYINIVLASILNGFGKSFSYLLHGITGIIIRIIFIVFLIPQIGMSGYLYGLLTSEIITALLHIFKIITILQD